MINTYSPHSFTTMAPVRCEFVTELPVTKRETFSELDIGKNVKSLHKIANHDKIAMIIFLFCI